MTSTPIKVSTIQERSNWFKQFLFPVPTPLVPIHLVPNPPKQPVVLEDFDGPSPSFRKQQQQAISAALAASAAASAAAAAAVSDVAASAAASAASAASAAASASAAAAAAEAVAEAASAAAEAVSLGPFLLLCSSGEALSSADQVDMEDHGKGAQR
jgi:hypothetical protein